jgi:hypothetical protein
MKLFTQGRYATVASTAALVVALGGTSYAAAQITSADIKDGTIQTKDINAGSRTTVKSIHNDNGTAMSSTKTVLSMNLPTGSYLVSGKAVAESFTNGAYASCFLAGPSGATLDTSWWYGGAGYGYGTLANEAVITLNNAGTVQLRCFGSSSTLYNKRLTAVRVAGVADLTGADVAKSAQLHSVTPQR